MNWIYIALLSGNLITSQHDTEEACLGRKAILEKENKITNAKCINMMTSFYGSIGTITLSPSTNTMPQ